MCVLFNCNFAICIQMNGHQNDIGIEKSAVLVGLHPDILYSVELDVG